MKIITYYKMKTKEFGKTVSFSLIARKFWDLVQVLTLHSQM